MLSKLLIASLAVVVFSIIMVRLIPDPERTAHTLFEEQYFTVSPELGPFHKFKILQTGKDTDGKVFAAQDVYTPDAGTGSLQDGCVNAIVAPPYHIHTKQKETFTILQGDAVFVADGKTSLGHAGDKVEIPAGQKHTFCRAPNSTSTLNVKFTLEPALDSHLFFTTFVGIHRDSQMKPSPIHLIYLVCASDMRLADIPWPIHELMCSTLSWMAPLMGYRLEYEKYAVESQPPTEEEVVVVEKEL